MAQMKILMIGLGTASLFAAVAARKHSKDAKIVIVDRKDFDILSTCGLPFVLEGKVKSFEDLKESLHSESMGIEIRRKHEALKIMPDKKKVLVKDLTTRDNSEISYDRLILDLGASPRIPKIPGLDDKIKGVFTMHTLEDAKNIKGLMRKGRKAVVLGAGAIGLELAHAFSASGMEVTVIERAGSLLSSSIDHDISEILKKDLENQGIRFIMGSALKGLGSSQGRLMSLKTSEGSITCDMLVIAAGVQKNMDIARECGIEVSDLGIVTDKRMQTSIPGIFAAGDCVSTRSRITGKPASMLLATAACRQGAVAGTNAAGGDDVYMGAQSTFVSKIGQSEVASTGFNTVAAEKQGFKVVAAKVRSTTRPEWFAGFRPLVLKLLADSKIGQIVGAQAIGGADAAAKINVISAAISAGFTVSELRDLELAYCPAVSTAFDIINQAAELAIRKLSKKR
jgi:NADH oxidase (H2O2-forming)